MRIHLNKIDNPQGLDLGARLSEIYGTELSRRNRDRDGDSIRLEAFEVREGLCFCDFIRLRMRHGPSRAGANTAASGFNLKADEGFGEETALIIDPSSGWCVMQYNHHGPRPGTISDYIGLFVHGAPTTLEMVPKLDPEIEAKIRNGKTVTKFELSVLTGTLTNEDFEQGQSVGKAVKVLAAGVGAKRVHLTVSASLKSGGLIQSLKDLMPWIVRLGGGERHSPIRSAKATALAEEGSKPETLDLLRHRIFDERKLQPGADKRYSVADRWQALEAVRDTWKHLMH